MTLSVRARLTSLVVVVALGLGVLAATVGLGTVERDLVDTATNAAADEQLSFIDDLIEITGAFDSSGDVDFAEEFELEGEIENLVFLLDELRRSDGLAELQGALDREGGEPFEVLTYFGEVVRFDPVELTIDIVEEGELVGPVVPQPVIEELVFVTQDFDLDEVFDVQGGLVLLPSVEDEFEFAVAERVGVEFLVFTDIGDVRASVERLRTIAWLAVPLLTLGAGALAWLLTGRALRPVHAITSQVSRISGGNLDERVPKPDTEDEIAELAETMNAMLHRLEADDVRLRQFVSDASHELRSPVAVLRSEAEVAALDPEQTTVAELAEGVIGEVDRLQRIVEDLLVLARGDERQRGGAGEVDVDDIVLAEASRRRRLPVDIHGVSAGRITGSAEAVQRVVTHLLDNAARHGATQVSVGLQADDRTVSLWVDDDGPGVPEADRQRIFERFTRLDDARTRDRGGAGLGLAVVAETMRAMRGSVEVVESPSGGARFTVRWPAVAR